MERTIIKAVYGFIRKQFGERISGDIILSMDDIPFDYRNVFLPSLAVLKQLELIHNYAAFCGGDCIITIL